ncbi:MAG: VOC family protein [Actinomycetota bacterium]|nr:VOC family protein [Actinomycetota bacterium]
MRRVAVRVPSRVSTITLGVRDFETMRDFYRRLGWEEGTSSGEPYAVFRTAGALLALFPIAALAADANAELEVREGFKGFTLALYVERAQLVDETLAAARAAGANVVKNPGEAFGGRSGYFADPEGNRWEVGWLPTVRFDDRGSLLDL